MPDVVWFDDVDDLVDAVGGAPTEAVINRVAEEAKKILLKHIKSDIYDVYTPKPGAWVNGTTYQRRHVLETHVTSSLLPDGTLLITSDAPANQSIVKGYRFSNEDSGFLQLLESGHMGIWKSGFARPVIANAQKEVDNSDAIRTAFERGMEREMNT